MELINFMEAVRKELARTGRLCAVKKVKVVLQSV